METARSPRTKAQFMMIMGRGGGRLYFEGADLDGCLSKESSLVVLENRIGYVHLPYLGTIAGNAGDGQPLLVSIRCLVK